jgi:hypothetical protein
MKIEPNQSIPEGVGKRKYPFNEMKPGDSIFFPGEFAGSKSKPAIAARAYMFKRGKRFGIKTTEDGLRIYCLSQKAGGIDGPIPHKVNGKYQFHKMQIADTTRIPASEMKQARACYQAYSTRADKQFKETNAGDYVVVIRTA